MARVERISLLSWILIILSPIFGLLVMNILDSMTAGRRKWANIIGLILFIVYMLKFSDSWFFPFLGVLNALI